MPPRFPAWSSMVYLVSSFKPYFSFSDCDAIGQRHNYGCHMVNIESRIYWVGAGGLTSMGSLEYMADLELSISHDLGQDRWSNVPVKRLHPHNVRQCM